MLRAFLATYTDSFSFALPVCTATGALGAVYLYPYKKKLHLNPMARANDVLLHTTFGAAVGFIMAAGWPVMLPAAVYGIIERNQ